MQKILFHFYNKSKSLYKCSSLLVETLKHVFILIAIKQLEMISWFQYNHAEITAYCGIKYSLQNTFTIYFNVIIVYFFMSDPNLSQKCASNVIAPLYNILEMTHQKNTFFWMPFILSKLHWIEFMCEGKLCIFFLSFCRDNLSH